VLGLLAAACGVPRGEEETHRQMARAYGLGVRVDREGHLLRDYHTVQLPPRAAVRRRPPATRREELEALAHYRLRHPKYSGTILSSREYRSDGLWTAAVWIRTDKPPFPLESLLQHLKRPLFVLYLGRKSCPPAMGLQPQIIPASTLAAAFASARFTDPEDLCKWAARTSSELQGSQTYFWDDDPAVESGLIAVQRNSRRDEPASRRRWQFIPRDELKGTTP
jgi:CRISPR system Cascade subunit CasD